jgi:hypothetical protein
VFVKSKKNIEPTPVETEDKADEMQPTVEPSEEEASTKKVFVKSKKSIEPIVTDTADEIQTTIESEEEASIKNVFVRIKKDI